MLRHAILITGVLALSRASEESWEIEGFVLAGLTLAIGWIWTVIVQIRFITEDTEESDPKYVQAR